MIIFSILSSKIVIIVTILIPPIMFIYKFALLVETYSISHRTLPLFPKFNWNKNILCEVDITGLNKKAIVPFRSIWLLLKLYFTSVDASSKGKKSKYGKLFSFFASI